MDSADFSIFDYDRAGEFFSEDGEYTPDKFVQNLCKTPLDPENQSDFLIRVAGIAAAYQIWEDLSEESQKLVRAKAQEAFEKGKRETLMISVQQIAAAIPNSGDRFAYVQGIEERWSDREAISAVRTELIGDAGTQRRSYHQTRAEDGR